MKKRYRILLAALVAVMIGGLAWMAWPEPPEPIYQSKTLSVWLEQYISNYWQMPGNAQRDQAQLAIRHIGTNAIPRYLELMTTRESRLKLKLIRLIPSQWQARLHVSEASYQSGVEQTRILGAFGIVALGSDAKTAVPSLIGLLSEGDVHIRWRAVWTLGRLGPTAGEAVPTLIKCLKDPDGDVRCYAGLSLGEIGREPERVVPILIESLGSKDFFLGYGALCGLHQFKADAKPAVPLIITLLSNANNNIQSEAVSALRDIDPAAAAKVGLK